MKTPSDSFCFELFFSSFLSHTASKFWQMCLCWDLLFEVGPLLKQDCLSQILKDNRFLCVLLETLISHIHPLNSEINHVGKQHFVFGLLKFFSCWANPRQPPKVLLILFSPGSSFYLSHSQSLVFTQNQQIPPGKKESGESLFSLSLF